MTYAYPKVLNGVTGFMYYTVTLVDNMVKVVYVYDRILMFVFS